MVPKFLKSFFNTFKNENGIVHILPLILILGGIITGVYLVQKEGFQIFNSKATAESIQLEDGSCIKVQDGKKVLTCGNFSFKLYSPIDSNQSSDARLNMSIVKPVYAAGSGKDYYCGQDRTKIYHDGWFSGWFGPNSENCPAGTKCQNRPPIQGKYTQDLDGAECREDQTTRSQGNLTPDNKPINIFPAKDAKYSLYENGTITFNWTHVANAKSYRLFINDIDNFYNSNETSYTLSASELNNGKSNIWWVDALGADGIKIEGATSDGTQFTVHKQSPLPSGNSATSPSLDIAPIASPPVSRAAPAAPTANPGIAIPGRTSGGTTPTADTRTSTVGSQTNDDLKITLCGTEMTLREAKRVVTTRGYNGSMDVVSVGNEYLKTMCPGSQNDCSLEPNFPEVLEATPKVGSTEYIWVANCNRACLKNNSTGNDKDLLVDPNPNDPAACPKNYSDGNVNPATSNWCYGFKDGNRCMVLWSKQQYQAIKTSGGNPFNVGNPPQNAAPVNPTARRTVGYRVSEIPLDNISESQIPFISYTTGVQVQHILNNSTPGIKSIFVQFKDNQDNIVKANPYPFIIQLISESQTPAQGTQSTTCVVDQTECSCGNTLVGDTRNPGSCSPECSGGWCKGNSSSSKGGVCATCKP